MNQADELTWLSEQAGPARAARLTQLAARSPLGAESLYRLDEALRDALRPELEAVEVTLRNRYHDVLTRLRPGQQSWLVDPSLPARRSLEARWGGDLRALLAGRCSEDDVVERVSFGFWAGLTAGRHEQVLWIPYLRRAFSATPSRKSVHRAVEQTLRLRNQVHHYDTVVDQPLAQRLDDMFWLLDRLNPERAMERRIHTRVPGLLTMLRQRGVPRASH